MTCQKCRDQACVHLTETIDGHRREIHLCGPCAKKAGLPLETPAPDLGLDQIMQALITAHVGELVGDLAQRSCPDCGVKYMEFRAQGMLGCPADYDAFHPGLLPLLRRTHGATRHVGKVPRRGASSSDRLRIRSRLKRAVAQEQYEEAASLRDQLRRKEGTVR
jgi:protein arginine kinase activator